jgi:hypothetical protein
VGAGQSIRYSSESRHGLQILTARIFLISVVQAPSNFWFPLIAAASPFSAAFYVLSLISIAHKRRVNREREKLGHPMNK